MCSLGNASEYFINGVHVALTKYTEELAKIGIVTKAKNCLVFQVNADMKFSEESICGDVGYNQMRADKDIPILLPTKFFCFFDVTCDLLHAVLYPFVRVN